MTARLLIDAAWGYAALPGPRIEHARLVVEGDRIVAFGPAHDVPDDADVHVEVEGGLVPGFVDAHVHLHFDGGADPIASVRAASDADLEQLARRNAMLLLRAGVTTARDLGGRGTALVRLRERIRSGVAAGPDLVIAGAPLTTPDGHVWYLGGGGATVDELLDILARQADAGADAVKVVASGGFLTAGTHTGGVQFDARVLSAVVESAHARGLQVAAHAHSSAAIAAAADAGVDSIEHATFIQGDRIDVDPATVAALVAKGIAICPTVNSATAGYPPAFGVEALRRLRRLHTAGVPVLMGTDAGVAGVTGDAYAAGLEQLVAAGFGAGEVLGIATTAAADLLGLSDRGRLAPGMRADAVALPADPITDITACRHPRAVLAGGRWWTREDLR